MKYTLYLLLLLSSLTNAQELAMVSDAAVTENYISNERLLTVADFKFNEGRMSVTEIPCKVQINNNTHTILVSVVCRQNAFNQLGVAKINDMILTANEKALHSLRPDCQYLPREIKMAYIPDSHDWSLTTAYTVADHNGVAKDGLLAIDFDVDGKFSKMKKIL